MNENKLSISRNVEGIKSVAFLLSALVYLLVILYAEYHFFHLVTEFVPAGMEIVGVIAVGASFLTAVGLPLAIHYWFRSGHQLIGGWIFYGIHFVVVFANLILDSALTSAGNAPPFITDVYAVFVLPGYIGFYALAWSILWFVDSGSQRIDQKREAMEKEEDARLRRQNLVNDAKNNGLEMAYQSVGAQQTINRMVARTAPLLLAKELGVSLDELGPVGDFEFWMTPANKPEVEASKEMVAAASPGPVPVITRPPVNTMRGPVPVLEDLDDVEMVDAPRPTSAPKGNGVP